ncbi:MAG: MerR family transcriptional regulator [Proteobacteria bacterium]|nr:MerR family transcriptional regulator [Pseudomonadota bacterium]
MATHNFLDNAMAELLDDAPQLTLEELAHSCCMAPDWVVERLQAGLLHAEQAGGRWQFSSATVVRARRLARLEASFDADPELAALTTDLIEEVAVLRQRLRQLGLDVGTARH